MGMAGPSGITTPIPTIMTDAARLELMQWLSPAFPLGSFAYSHGLEAAIAAGDVTDAGSLEAWAGAVLDAGSGLADAVLLVAAMAEGADHEGLDGIARALAASAERWEETRAQGQAFTETVNGIKGRAEAPLALPVAVGRAARDLGLPAEEVAGVYLQAFATTLVLAAVRFVPLGQTEGQAVLARLRPVVLRVAARAAGMAVEEITTSVPGADLAAMAHETMDVRIFRT